jgi:hypothetical protein
MKLIYKKIAFTIALAKPVLFPIPVTFLFRSIIGRQLHALCCINTDGRCILCPYSRTCVYGTTFESIVPKDNPVLTGSDRLSHPVIIDTDIFVPDKTDTITFNLIFFGSSLGYFPYFFYALKAGGKAGILRERIPYTIIDTRADDHSLLINADTVDVNIPSNTWEYDDDNTDAASSKTILVQLQSPLRFKVDGRYTHQFSPADFAYCLHRRTQTLCELYGAGSNILPAFSKTWTMSEQHLVWSDYTHYSARQKNAMRLGGVTGDFVLSGSFTPYEYALLQSAELFHAGKNTNFGLGKLVLTEKL